jgi:hypothetical protein
MNQNSLNEAKHFDARGGAMARDFFAARAALLLGAFILVAAFFYNLALSKVYLNLGDGWWEYSLAAFFKANVSRGIFPLWNPDTGFGVPEWIVICPFSLDRLFLFFLPQAAVWNLIKILNFILSGWLLSLFLLRKLDAFFPAFLGGLMAAVAQLNLEISFASYFLFVLSFLLAERLIRLRSYSAGAIFSVALLTFFCNSLPQPIICGSLFLFCYVAIRFRLHKHFNLDLWLLGLFPFVIALMFFSPQIFRMKEVLDLSVRFKVADREVFSILPWEYLNMFWPNFTMVSQDSTLNFIPARMLAALQNHFLKFVNVNFGQSPYYGILPFFSIACLFFKRHICPLEKKGLFFTLVLLFVPILNPVLYPLIKHIPIIGVASGGSLFWALYSHVLLLIVAILTALSFSYISGNRAFSEFNLGGIKKLFVGIAVFVLLASSFRLFIHFAFHANAEHIQKLFFRWLPPLFSSAQFRLTAEFYSLRIAQASEFLKFWASPYNAYFVVPVFLILGSMALLYGRLTQKIGKMVFFMGSVVLFLVDAQTFRAQPSHSPQEIAPFQAEADYIKKDKTIFRVMALQDTSPKATDAAGADTRNIVLRPETHLLYGLSSPECLRSLVLKNYADYMSLMTVEGVRGRLVGEFGAIKDFSLLDLANIKYIIAPLSKGTDVFSPARYELIYKTLRCNIFRNKFSRERAFFLHPPKGGGGIFVQKYSPHLVRLTVNAGVPNELVLTDLYYPGWVAYVDGIKTPITIFQGTFRKIVIPVGSHIVEFKFQPTHLMLGMFLPFLGFLLGGWAVIRERKSPELSARESIGDQT